MCRADELMHLLETKYPDVLDLRMNNE